MENNQGICDALIKICEGIKQFFTDLRRAIEKWVRSNWKWIKEVVVKWNQLERKKKIVVRQRHKRDFSGQKMSHQVVNRKPQHMARKIIR